MKKLRFGSVIAFLSLIILINVNGQSLKKDVLVGNWNPASKEKTETNVSEMTDSERKKMISILENWLSLEIEDVFHNKE